MQFDKPLGAILSFDDNTYDNNGSFLQEMHAVDCPCNFRGFTTCTVDNLLEALVHDVEKCGNRSNIGTLHIFL